MLVLWPLVALWLGVCLGEQPVDSDSLRGALAAINRRQRDLADPTLYYLGHIQPSRDESIRIMYPRHGDGDGQPENIGYGYQKSLAPKTAGVFDNIPLPEDELGSHDPGVNSFPPDSKSLENILLDYIENNIDNSVGKEPINNFYQKQHSDKRSVFRERDINHLPESLQSIYAKGEDFDQNFENLEHYQGIPSSFRERVLTKPSKHFPLGNAQHLVRHFGGLNRDTDIFPENDDDSDEYLSILNSLREKYHDSNPDTFDAEDLSENDVEEILDFLNHKKEVKRQHDNSNESGIDFINLPMVGIKQNKQRLTENIKSPSDPFLHALRFLNGHTNMLEPIHEEDVPEEEKDIDVAKLLMEEHQIPRKQKQLTKRFWRGNTLDYHKNIIKRYPITKRSSSSYTNPTSSKERPFTKNSSEQNNNRKNHMAEEITDPKVEKELNDIFSSSEITSRLKKNNNTMENNNFSKPEMSNNFSKTKTFIAENLTNNNKSQISIGALIPNHEHSEHSHKKLSGQKEETIVDSQHKPLDMSKKSVDWSDYFGIDKRHKKNSGKAANDDWLLDQYLKAYTISAKAIKDSSDRHTGNTNFKVNKRNSDDMDAKLRAMEDMIVDQALKYTGAHEGVTDSEEIQAVKDQVITQLAAAYSLEKMRKALSEFKSSIALQKSSASSHTTTNSPTDLPDKIDKRVAIKKEKAEMPPVTKVEKKEDSDNDISILQSSQHSHIPTWTEEGTCQVIDDITQRCTDIAKMEGYNSKTLLSLCTLHQICYLCGSEIGTTPSECDLTFLSKANSLCGGSPHCRYSVRRTVAIMHSHHEDQGCDWQNNPCLARYLTTIMR